MQEPDWMASISISKEHLSYHSCKRPSLPKTSENTVQSRIRKLHTVTGNLHAIRRGTEHTAWEGDGTEDLGFLVGRLQNWLGPLLLWELLQLFSQMDRRIPWSASQELRLLLSAWPQLFPPTATGRDLEFGILKGSPKALSQGTRSGCSCISWISTGNSWPIGDC